MDAISNIFVFITRYILPILVGLFLFLCAKRMFAYNKKAPFAQLVMCANRAVFPIENGECAIGRGALCDMRINVGSISRRHAVLSFTKYGFKISMVSPKTEIYVNDILVDGYAYIEFGDIIRIGGVEFELQDCSMEDVYSNSSENPTKHIKSVFLPAIILTVIQLIFAISFVLYYGAELSLYLPLSFGVLMIAQWIYLAIKRLDGGCGVELIGFFLTSLGFCVISTASVDDLLKQCITFAIGFFGFIILNLILKDMEITMKLRYFIGAVAILILLYNLVFGINLNGAKNWISLGPITIQPSEIVKIAFIFVGAATLERLVTTRNFILFLIFSSGVIGALFIMRDFGTASIYFITMLVIIYMRSGDVKTVLAILGLAVVGAFGIIKIMPYVASRFAAYRHVWELASTQGYQQTRTMVAISSGGLFGLGGGKGNLDLVSASDTDLVFGILCEEWGLIIGLCVLACFVLLAVYVFRFIGRTTSAYYAISATATASLYLFQSALNVFGSTDLLPLTGVTLPFVSNGGSSMIASWCLLAFIKVMGEQAKKGAEVAVCDK